MNTKVIFFGNGPLADAVLATLRSTKNLDILFHAKTRDDLKTVKSLKTQNPSAFGILTSFGVLIKNDLLELFEPEGVLNIHPSLLPKYRGASPIESAILAGDASFSVSIMKLVKAMDAGPIYFQTTLNNLPLDKSAIYSALATAGASWLIENLNNFIQFRFAPSTPERFFPTFHPQTDTAATFTKKLDKSMSHLTPETDTAETTLRKIVAFQSFPKPKYKFFNQEVIILSAHIEKNYTPTKKDLFIPCLDTPKNNTPGTYLLVDKLQPLSRNPMSPSAFLNGIKNLA